jgi:hypothetical protein
MPSGRNALRSRDTLRSRDAFPWLRASGRWVEVEKLLLLRRLGPAVPVKVCRVHSLLPGQAALFPGADLLLVRYFLRRSRFLRGSRFPGGSGFFAGAVVFGESVVFGADGLFGGGSVFGEGASVIAVRKKALSLPTERASGSSCRCHH